MQVEDTKLSVITIVEQKWFYEPVENFHQAA